MYIKYTFKQNSEQKKWKKYKMSRDPKVYNVAMDMYLKLLW